MYFTYCIHAQTYLLSVLKRYPSKKVALMNMCHDMEDFLEEYKSTRELNEIENKELLNKKSYKDGFYYKKSTMYQDRFNVYEKKTETVGGYMWNSYIPKVQKVLIFSVFEDPMGPKVDLSQAALLKKSLASIQVIKQSLRDDSKLDNDVQDELIKELKACLKARRRAISDSVVTEKEKSD